jgi:hypothetical protein
MGRRNEIPNDYAGERLHLHRLRAVNGDYDQGGAYWGNARNIWCAWADEGESKATRIFVRAENRGLAKSLVREILPSAKFYR